ncbi:MAG: GIY-YIG nuclease family protein [Patescibacteria group bacterium]
MDKFKLIPKKEISKLAKTTGVYAFKNNGQFLYIGKAINIKSRVKDHFLKNNFKDKFFTDQSNKIGFIKTNSEIEALILESQLIKKYKPKYNVMWKDDKSFFYIQITKEEFPRVYVSHKTSAEDKQIGPFTDSRALKHTLRILRRAFPYYTVKKHPKTKCPWCYLKLCPGPEPDKQEYKKNIKKIIKVLEGKNKSVLNNLKKEMKILAKKQDYETAAKTRDQIWALENIMAHTRYISPYFERIEIDWKVTEKYLQKILKTKENINRIEAYDISNIQGQQATGSMVVFEKGKSNKSLYRKFKIKTIEGPNDTGMIKEVLSRRLHNNWPKPDLILIDGGKGQLNSALSIKKEFKIKAPIISLAKKNNELFLEKAKKPILLKDQPRDVFNLIIQLRDESHRFAISYHKLLRKKTLLK